MSAAVDGLKVATAVASVYAENEKAEESGSFSEVVRALEAGDPAIFPTDTVFGLGVAVDAAPSPEALYRLKRRSERKPIAWLVEDASALERYGQDVPSWVRGLAEVAWPGALTLVVKASEAVPYPYRSAEGTIALRVPDHEVTRALIYAVGPLATTSANLSGDPAAVTLEGIAEDLSERVRVLPGRTYGDGRASSVIDCTQKVPRIVREGALDETVAAFLRRFDEPTRPEPARWDKPDRPDIE